MTLSNCDLDYVVDHSMCLLITFCINIAFPFFQHLPNDNKGDDATL